VGHGRESVVPKRRAPIERVIHLVKHDPRPRALRRDPRAERDVHRAHAERVRHPLNQEPHVLAVHQLAVKKRQAPRAELIRQPADGHPRVAGELASMRGGPHLDVVPRQGERVS
jgi:hypothetical protein